jgi:ABC-type Mn2+/Zn2+ transport system permease subunit
VFSGLAGLYLSYYVAVASGAAIVLVSTACFAAAWLVTRLRRA